MRRDAYGNNLSGLIGFIFCMTQILNVLGFVSNSMGLESIFSFVSKIYIVLNLGSFFLYLISSKNDRGTGGAILLVILMVISAVFSYLMHSEGSSMFNFCILLSQYVALPIYMIFLREIWLSKKMLNCVFNCYAVTAVYFIYRAVVHPNYFIGTSALTMGFFNANQAAIFLMQNISVLLPFYAIKKDSVTKLFVLGLCATEIYLIELTQSRAALLCAIILAFFFIRRHRIAIPKWFVWVLLAVPVAVMVLFINPAIRAVLSAVEILGKPLLNGRDTIYFYAMLNLQGNALFGNYGASQFANLHNAYLSVLVTVGIVGFIVFCGFYCSQIMSFWKKHKENDVAYLAFSGLMLLFLEGGVEAAILVSGSMYAASTAPLILLMNYEDEESIW